ncbi:peroxide stress protein YaaA [Isoptericola halotolerans]|uniref:YaaA family protein n=1 Tax=Isoptericola halotolerans TaxID=300560 RepID=UPI00388E6438
MLICLPPSEGKTPAPDGGTPVDLQALTAPELSSQREAVLDALAAVSSGPGATEALKVGTTLADEVARNTTLRTAPAAAATDVYTGVLYTAAGLGDLTGQARALATDSVRTFSGLWGMVAPGDRIPAYRLSMSVDLPGVGKLATAWRPRLARALEKRAAGDVVVDCRSAAYLAAWKPATTGEQAAEWVTVRVVREADGRRTVVSHNAKHTRGVLTGHLLRRTGPPPSSADELLTAVRELDGEVIGTEVGTGLSYRMIEATLGEPSARSGSRVLELVIS